MNMTEATSKRRKPWLAVIFGLVGTGFGQLYNGQIIKGIVCYVCLAILGVLVIAGTLKSFNIGATLFCLAALLYFWTLIDAFRTARKYKEFHLKSYNRWYIYLVIIGGSLVINSNLTSHVKASWLEAFRFSSSSMEPTILAGDHILVDKTYFRAHAPRSGDIGAFTLPDDPQTGEIDESETKIIKRIVAVEGDSVQVQGTALLVNGVPAVEPYAVWRDGGREDFGRLTVAPQSVFLLGDNRDYSRDARHWKYPFVERSRLIGKVLYVYWPFSRLGAAAR